MVPEGCAVIMATVGRTGHRVPAQLYEESFTVRHSTNARLLPVRDMLLIGLSLQGGALIRILLCFPSSESFGILVVETDVLNSGNRELPL